VTQARAARVLVTTATVTTACVLPAFLIGATAVQLGDDLDLSASGTGVAVGAFFAAASLASAPLGRLTERLGSAPALRAAAAISATCQLGLAGLARSLPVLLAFLAVGGSANALAQPAANLLLARDLPLHRQGLGFAIKQAAIPLATLLSGLAVPTIALTVGWRWAFVASAALALASITTVPRTRSTGTPRAPRPSHDRSGDMPLPVMVWLALGIALGAASAGTLGAFFVSAGVDAGLAEGTAGLVLAAGSGLGIATRLAAGVRADRRGGGHLRVVALMLAGGAVVYCLLATETTWAFVVAGPLAFATGWAWPGLFNLAVVRVNPNAPGAATGITQTGTYLGAVVGPVLFGLVAEHFSFRAAWLGAAAMALLAALTILAARRRVRAWRDGATDGRTQAVQSTAGPGRGGPPD
jgi:MFS family permease